MKRSFVLFYLILAIAVVAPNGVFAATPQPGYPVPHIGGAPKPSAVAPGGPSFSVRIFGANFINGSVVNWNGAPRATTYVSGHELDAQILASDIVTNTAGLITVTTNSPNGPITSSTFTQLEVHTPTSTFNPAPNPQTLSYENSPAEIADLNRDGNLDIVAYHFNVVDQFKVWLGAEDGVFKSGPYASQDSLICTNFILGDFNGDGIPDILFISGNTKFSQNFFIQLNLGNGDGTFRPFGHIGRVSLGDAYGTFVVGDFNQDGVLDFGYIDNGGLRIYLGNGDGTFHHGAFAFAGGFPRIGGAVVADVNGDGKLDIVAIIQHPFAPLDIRVLLGNGDGTFQHAVVVNTQVPNGGVTNLLLTDVNGDGIPDLIYSANYNTVLQIGNGDGTFQSGVVFTDVTIGVTTGDFNSDGVVDMFIAGGLGGVGVVYLGNGDGTFRTGQTIILTATSGWHAGDFNKDGLLDLYNGTDLIILQQ